MSGKPRRLAAASGFVRDSARVGGSLVPWEAPGATLPAENRDFPDAKSRGCRQPPIPRHVVVPSSPGPPIFSPGRGTVRESAPLGIFSIRRPGNRPSRHVPGMGEKNVSGKPRRSAAASGLVRDPALVGGPRVALGRPEATLPAENRDFPDAKSRECRQPPIPRRVVVHTQAFHSMGRSLEGRASMPATRGRIPHLPSAEKNAPLSESPQLMLSF